MPCANSRSPRSTSTSFCAVRSIAHAHLCSLISISAFSEYSTVFLVSLSIEGLDQTARGIVKEYLVIILG